MWEEEARGKMMRLIIYHSHISKIGGCETFIYNLCKNLKNYYDITFMYKTADINQLLRISRYVSTEKYDSSKEYKTDICICSSAWGGFPDSIEAKEYIQMLHADYEEMAKIGWKYYAWSKTTKHVAVSKAVADSFEKLYKIKPDLIYNILDIKQETKPILKLISATRLSKEKRL